VPRTSSDPEVVLNEFLRRYLEDREAGGERTADEYSALFPGHGELIERELAALRGKARGEAPIRAASRGAGTGTAPSPAQESAAGKRFGSYVLVRPLGQGGQGLVWLARDTRLDRLVALKLLTQLAALSEQALERFHREAQVASRLDDPGICAIYETGSEHGVHYIAMRHVEGESLATLLDRARSGENTEDDGPRFPALPADPDEGSGERVPGAARSERSDALNSAPPRDAAEAVERAVRLFERLARSLHRAHEAGVVHRDVKPGNVMVARNGRPVLLDFGLAGVLDESLPTFTRTGDVFGTPAYMAPEQLAPESGQGRRVDRRSDVYALGATLYECLTLRHPFESVTREALYQAIREQDPCDPRRTNPAIHADLWTILQTCLAKERSRRYQSALELADDLRRFREGKPIHAHPPSRVYRARRFVKRYRVLVTATLIVVAALAAATVVATAGLFRARRAEDKATLAAESESRLKTQAQASAAEASRQRDRAREGELAARRSAYTAQMQLAFTAWENRNWARVLQLLEAQAPSLGEPDLRGFEWYCLWKLCHTGLLARFRDPESSQPVALAVAADGASFVTLDSSGRATRRRIDDGAILEAAELGCFPRLGYFHYGFSRDGRRLGIFDDRLTNSAIDVLDTEGWRRVLHLELPSSNVMALSLSQDGKLLAWKEDGTRIAVVDVERGAQVLELDAGIALVHAIAFDPSASHLAIGGSDGGRAVVQILDLAAGKEVGRFDGLGQVEALDYSPDGKRLAVGGQEWVVRVLDAESAREIAQLNGHQGGVLALAFAPDGRTLATLGGSDSTLRIWNVEEQAECSPLRAISVPFANCLATTPAGDRLLTLGSGDAGVSLWATAEKGSPVTIAAPLDVPHDPFQFSLLAFSPDSRTLALNERSGALSLLDIESHAMRGTLESGAQVTCAAFSPDGSTVWLGTKAGELASWDAREARVLGRVHAHDGQVDDLALSPDGRSVASSGKDGKVALWDATTLAGKGSHSRHGAEVYCLLFDPDGTGVLSSGKDGRVWHWKPAEGAEPEPAPSTGFFELVRAPKGADVAAVSKGWLPELRNSTLRRQQVVFTGHAGGTYRAIAFAPDGRTLATGSVDKTVRLWQVETGQEVCTLKFGSHVHSVAFSPDGRKLATWSCDGVLKLWPAATPDEVARLSEDARQPQTLDSDASLELTSPWRAAGGQAKAWFGYPVAAAGDVDGDGLDDFLAGASHWGVERENEGAAFLFRGSAQGPANSPSWSATGGQPGAIFGAALGGAGDVNGDGYDDAIIGRGNGLGPDPGGASLYLGSPSGLASAPAWTMAGDQPSAWFGQGVAGAGDVNGDGFDDVLVGAHGSDGEQAASGRAFLYLGSARGLDASPAWTARGAQTGAHFGYSLSSAGDVNADGFDDVLVGAYYYDGSWIDEGKVFLYLGSISGLSREPVWTREGGQPNGAFGYSVSKAGDVNGDGFGDLVVAAHLYDHRFHDEGKAFLFLGAADGIPRASDWSPEGRQAGAYFGCWVATAGDVNGDGFADVLVGATAFDLSYSDEGRASLYLGSVSGLSSTPCWTGHGGQARAEFSGVSPAGDVNGDGFGDFLVGSYAYDDERSEGGGLAVLYYGRAAEGVSPSTPAGSLGSSPEKPR